MNTKEAIVLAGGLGTRLRDTLPGIPKCMAPVKGKPFLSYVLDYLISQEIEKVILSVGYRKDHIINYFGNTYQSLSIEYAVEDDPLGTGGAIKQSFTLCKQDNVFVINGDTYFLPDLKAMEIMHFETSSDITIAVKLMTETGRYGLISTDKDGRINEFREKDTASEGGWINGGIYMINRKIFADFPEQRFSLENDVFRVSCSNYKMQAFRTKAFFLDMGIPEDYQKALTLITVTGKA